MRKKLLSVFMIMAMIFSVFVPVVKAISTSTTVIVHKIVMSKEDMTAHQNKSDEARKYDPSNALTNLQDYFGSTAKEVDGIYFVALEKDKPITDYLSGGSYDFSAVPDAQKGLTKDGKLELVLPDNKEYKIYEIKELSTYVGPDGALVAESLAVPVEISLPLINESGVMKTVHVYPKNTENKPKVDKNFKGLANPNSPKDKSAIKPTRLGEDVEYEIKTIIPVKSNYKTAKWSDEMTEGLSFNEDSLKVAIGETPLSKGDQYEVVKTTNGFTVSLKKVGLDMINDKTEETNITISYSAKLNSKAVVNIPESNDVVFVYGNKPSHGNAPIPRKPIDGTIKVGKSWSGTYTGEVTVSFYLYDAQTGKLVDKEGLNNPMVFKKNGDTSNLSFNWTGLTSDREYKVVEKISGVDGFVPEYKVDDSGIAIVNHKEDNPPPINPEEPKVVTYGKKFIKTNDKDLSHDELLKLAGAEFIVSNEDGSKFLKLTDADTQGKALSDYYNAEAAYTAKHDEYNAEKDSVKRAAIKEQLPALKVERDKAFVAINIEWEWVDSKTDAFKFISGEEGKFEINGLPAGKYAIVETKAPKGYAQIGNPLPFEITENTSINAVEMQVKNMTVTIPQTGGIGTVIFTVSGLALMGGALIAMKRRGKEQ